MTNRSAPKHANIGQYLASTFTHPQTDTINATLTDYSNGLPEIPGMRIQPRPTEFMPAPYDFRDPTAVSKSVEL